MQIQRAKSDTLRQPLLSRVVAPRAVVRFENSGDLESADSTDHSSAPTGISDLQKSHAFLSLAFFTLWLGRSVVCGFSILDTIGCLILTLGHSWLFFLSSSARLLDSSLYSGGLLTAADTSRKFCGTSRLRGNWLCLMGVLVLGIGSIWSERLGYTFGSIFLGIGYSLELQGDLPSSLLAPYNANIVQWLENSGRANFAKHLGTFVLAGAWLRMIVGGIWLIGEAAAWDSSEGSEEIVGMLTACFLLIGGYFRLREAYREGTVLDTLLVENSRKPVIPSPKKLGEPESVIVAEPIVHVHPLGHGHNFSDPAALDIPGVVKAALNFMASEKKWLKRNALPDGAEWSVSPEGLAAAVSYPCSLHPLLAAGIYRSEIFKKTAAGGDPEKYKWESNQHGLSTDFICETRGADPPLPASSASYVSHTTEIPDK